jgi:hypothetical protein
LQASVNADNTKLLFVTIHLSNMGHFTEMNEVWDAWVLPGHAPAWSRVEARLAKPEYLVEMSVMAARQAILATPVGRVHPAPTRRRSLVHKAGPYASSNSVTNAQRTAFCHLLHGLSSPSVDSAVCTLANGKWGHCQPADLGRHPDQGGCGFRFPVAVRIGAR